MIPNLPDRLRVGAFDICWTTSDLEDLFASVKVDQTDVLLPHRELEENWTSKQIMEGMHPGISTLGEMVNTIMNGVVEDGTEGNLFFVLDAHGNVRPMLWTRRSSGWEIGAMEIESKSDWWDGLLVFGPNV